MLCDSVYMRLSKWRNSRDGEQISGYQGLEKWEGRDVTIKGDLHGVGICLDYGGGYRNLVWQNCRERGAHRETGVWEDCSRQIRPPDCSVGFLVLALHCSYCPVDNRAGDFSALFLPLAVYLYLCQNTEFQKQNPMRSAPCGPCDQVRGSAGMSRWLVAAELWVSLFSFLIVFLLQPLFLLFFNIFSLCI